MRIMILERREAVRQALRAQPLIQLLLVNLMAGLAASVLSVGGLVALNPMLRHLIVEDRSPITAVGLLLFGFVVTLCSCVMGAAVMGIGNRH